jgi:sec-independent protein translocase protein TatC
MAKHPQEDLFEGTTMTFGDHIEELRGSLTRALIGLAVGSIIGLFFANHVVAIIQGPLIKALGDHYAGLAVAKLERTYGKDLNEEMKTFAKNSAFVYDEVYVERALLARLVAKPAKTENKSTSNPSPDSNETAPNETASIEAAPGETASGEEAHDDSSVATTTADNGQAAYDRMEELLKEVLPSPQPDMIKIRMWKPAKARLTALSPHESFMIWMKSGLVAGLLFASPYIFYQIWIFVAAGLYPHEKKYVHLYLPFSLLLFLSGAALAFFFVFGPVLSFLFSFARMLNIEPDLRIGEVISFVLFLPLGFGIAFQLPLVMLFIHRIGLISIETYIEKWRIAILAIFVVSMLLTPAAPYSMLLMAGPLTGLYFLGLALCKWMPRGKNPFTEAYDP